MTQRTHPAPAVQRPPGRWARHRPLVGVAAGLVGVAAATWQARPAAVPGIAAPGQLVEFGVPVARLLLELGATLTLGMALVPTLTGAGGRRTRPLSAQERQLRLQRAAVCLLAGRAATAAAALWLGAALAALPLQTAELNPGAPVTVGAVAEYVRGFGSGQALVASAAAAAVCVLGGLAGQRLPAMARALLAATGMVALVVVGHATSGATPWHAMMTDLLVLHVVAAAAWAGGLTAVLTLVAPHPALLAATLPRFSTVAGACLGTIALTGVFSAAVELSSAPGADLPTALLTSDYGLIVVAKAGCLLAVGAIGWHLRHRLLPAVVRHRRTAVVGWGLGEVALLGLAFGLAVALAHSPVIGS